MWGFRLAGALIAAIGALVFSAVFYQGFRAPLNDHLMFAIGMPGVLIIGMLGLIAFVFGVHLYGAAPRHAARVWPLGVRSRPKTGP